MSTKAKVLIIEDDPWVRDILTQVFERKAEFVEIFSEVRTASDGIEGLKLLETFKPDLIFTDVEMPGKDGIAIGSELRAKGVATPIIYFTSRASDEKIVAKIREITPYYLTKTPNFVLILGMVKVALGHPIG